jgi:AcrR family transcriptional regulator
MGTRRYEQRLRAVSAEDTRRRILAAVFERLEAAPTSPVSVDRVARDAGVARSTVYLVFGSRAGLFDAVASDLQSRAGFQGILDAVAAPDARDHLRLGVTAGCRAYAAHRDVTRALFSMSSLDPDAVGGAMVRLEQGRAGGMDHLARRLEEQRLLRADVDRGTAAHVLYQLTSFDCFDLLFTGRGLIVDDVATLLVTQAERTLLEG